MVRAAIAFILMLSLSGWKTNMWHVLEHGELSLEHVKVPLQNHILGDLGSSLGGRPLHSNPGLGLLSTDPIVYVCSLFFRFNRDMLRSRLRTTNAFR